MKKYAIALSILFFIPTAAFANCGVVPVPPTALESAQLDADQLEVVKGELSEFFVEIETYRRCVDQMISNIAPADAPLEYFDSQEYQAQFDTYEQLSSAAENKMKLATERFNYLVGIAN